MNNSGIRHHFDFSQFDSYYNPILIFNANKSLIYKNEISKILGTFRLGTSIERYIANSDLYLLNTCVEEKKPAILTLNSHLKGSKALFCPYPEDPAHFIAAVILSSHLICNMPSGHTVKAQRELFSNNIQTLRKFEDCLFKMTEKNERNEKYNKLLLRNTQLLARVERHFNIYVNKYRKIEDAENNEGDRIVNISHFIKEIYDFSLVSCAPLGYRIVFQCESDHIYVKLNRMDFICEFLSIVSLTLRMSNDRRLTIYLHETEQCAVISFSYHCDGFMEKMSCLRNELKFIFNAAKFLGWQMVQNHDPQDQSAITVSAAGFPIIRILSTVSLRYYMSPPNRRQREEKRLRRRVKTAPELFNARGIPRFKSSRKGLPACYRSESTFFS